MRTPTVREPRAEIASAAPPERPPGARARAAPEPQLEVPVPPPAGGRGDSPGGVPTLVLGLVVLSALPLTLSRLLAFEASSPNTAAEFTESHLSWTLAVVLPLVVAAVLLAAGHRWPGMLPVAGGLVIGEGLVLAENSAFWIFWFADNSDSYDVGPAVWCLVVGAGVVIGAAVLAARRAPLAGRPGTRSPDWRFATALLVVVAAVISIDGGPESYGFLGWVANSIGTLLMAVFALPLTLLRLRRDQRLAALVAVTLFGVWLVWFPISELVSDSPQLGLEPSRWAARISAVVLTLLACYLAQAGPTSDPAPRFRAPR